MKEDLRPTTRQALQKRYLPGECLILEEVSDTTGGRNRSADFIIVNLWPSRGNTVIGIEKKISRSDWLREYKMPSKQEAIFKFCDYFFLLTDGKDIAKSEEIPDSWGWMDINDKGLIKVIKDAPRLTPVPFTKGFLASMLRRADDKTAYVRRDSIKEEIEAAKEQATMIANRDAGHKVRDYDALAKVVKEFEEASGIRISDRWSLDPKKAGEAVRVLCNGEIESRRKQLENMEVTAKRILDNIERDLKIFEDLTHNP